MTKRQRKRAHNGRAETVVGYDGRVYKYEVKTTQLGKFIGYQVLQDGVPTSWGGVVKPGQVLGREIQATLRLMDKCGYGNKPNNLFTRSRDRRWEKEDKLQKWKESLKCTIGS